MIVAVHMDAVVQMLAIRLTASTIVFAHVSAYIMQVVTESIDCTSSVNHEDSIYCKGTVTFKSQWRNLIRLP